MSTEVKLIEKPINYALITTAIFLVSAFILGKAYKILALASLDLPTSSAWDAIENISGLDFDRPIRYFIFYFFSYLFFICFDRSVLKNSTWGLLVLFILMPFAMAFLPYVFSGEFHISSFWGISAMLMSLLYLGMGPRCESKILRQFFWLLLLMVMAMNVLSDVAIWMNEINQQAHRLFGNGDLSDKRTRISLFWLAPVELIKIGVQAYLVYWLPERFFKEARKDA